MELEKSHGSSARIPNSECKISIRFEMLPGKSVIDKLNNAKKFGFDGVALPGRFLSSYLEELVGCLADVPLPLVSMSLGFEGSLVSPRKEIRQKCRDSLLGLFDLCAKLGVKSLNMPPVLVQDNLERLVEEKAQDELLLSQLPGLCDEAEKRGVTLLLEPVNSYETEYLTTVPHAAMLCKKVNHSHIGITCDFFHMQTEELNIPNSILTAGKWIKLVHVAENTRVEPGPGSLDFKPGFKALKEIGYNGTIEIECRKLSGKPENVLPRSIEYLNGLWAIA